ncbi:MAG: prephenate dehydrogenase/arogenate dehydrogenase family protein [Gammaproteobacteria bacterium]|jgi:cyclohexadieny/prephenate dehydrogenase / 3-phosphoshikimate 1-carboxyvinyltransferase|nr:prephenate dehydrogenase/arogenate dehydrogenase family protein [Gammaproteobacteria bacterium]MBT4493533.1 prephenate dehydrogenase/arogenate dehydrogenase family protein [Gammaproteobacteria bacterium]MBT7370460.1 prephenate dehydrogenase/arogenate dehydrogenase family protein [Gammaproteobacteria bacterium]
MNRDKKGFGRVAILGLGLIGGSIAAALKQRGLAQIAAWDKDEKSLDRGLTDGIIDEVLGSPDEARGADLVVLAVPVLAIKDMLSAIDSDQVFTDVASVKGFVLEAVELHFGKLPPFYVPGHPIAGSERHGVGAANPNLFENHRVILTPTDETDESTTMLIAEFWRALGANVVEMTPDHHDSVLAQTSHLPHLLAYGLVDTLSAGGDSLEVFEHAAGGFRDFSRIAASDPVMWRDIFLTNPGPILEVLDRYLDEMADVRQMIVEGDGEALRELFARAKDVRDHFSSIDKARNNST